MKYLRTHCRGSKGDNRSSKGSRNPYYSEQLLSGAHRFNNGETFLGMLKIVWREVIG